VWRIRRETALPAGATSKAEQVLAQEIRIMAKRGSKPIVIVAGLALVLMASLVAGIAAQTRGVSAPPTERPGEPGRGRQSGPGYPKFFDQTMPFDPRDLAGVWTPNAGGFGGGGRCRDCGDRGYSSEFPEFTPQGQIAFDKNIPSYGRLKDSDDAKAHPEEHIGRRRAQPPALGNDTYGTCNPMGMPRAILYPDPVEFLVLNDRILQHFQWGYGLRTIWMDGRKVLNPDDVDIPRWWGYATGRWEGNTLVVESTGYDERTWVDYYGYPHSDQMILSERYTRINYDTIELKMTLTDPKYYRKPWTSETKRMHLLPKDFIKSSEWTGLLEDLCAPANELEFNRLIRDPAGTGKPAAAPTRNPPRPKP
jgi:hypothetical protein